MAETDRTDGWHQDPGTGRGVAHETHQRSTVQTLGHEVPPAVFVESWGGTLPAGVRVDTVLPPGAPVSVEESVVASTIVPPLK